MASMNLPLWISLGWIALTVATALILETASVRGWLLASLVAAIPVGVLLKLWNDEPPQTIAEVIRTTEGRR